MSIAAHPLQWPTHIPRYKAREAGRFKTTLHAALGNVEDSIRRFSSDSGKKVSEITISSNYSLGERRPADPGVAVWFTWDDMQICIPVDRYSTIEANLQAIHHVIEARRVELRHGTLALVRATFKGFLALPPPERSHWKILGLEPGAPKEAVTAAYRQLAATAHPDRTGSETKMAELNAARDSAMKEISA